MDGTIEASVKYVREYVHAYLNDVLEDARGQIETYGQSFNATMQAALHTRQQGVLRLFLHAFIVYTFIHLASCTWTSGGAHEQHGMLHILAALFA